MSKTVIITTVLMSMIGFSLVSPAKASDCCQAAEKWINSIDADREILRSHTCSNCRFSCGWVKKEQHADGVSRKRLCNDLVLVWTHKECIYFRDYVSHEAYDPCKAWSRQMFEHCMDNDVSWFNCQ